MKKKGKKYVSHVFSAHQFELLETNIQHHCWGKQMCIAVNMKS